VSDGIDFMVKNMRPVYKAGCCIQCGRKIPSITRSKLAPLFLNTAGDEIFLHPKCTEAFESNGEQYFAINPPEKYKRTAKFTTDNTVPKPDFVTIPKEDTNEKA
jgi:hypothetical protein